MDPQIKLTLFVIAAFSICFPLIWCGVCLLLSWGGWSALARQYRAQEPPSGECFSSQYGMVGWVSYKGVLTVHVSPEGLHVNVMRIFRVNHPPLFIPWSAINNARASRGFLWDAVAFEVGSPPIATMRLSRKVLEGQPISIP